MRPSTSRLNGTLTTAPLDLRLGARARAVLRETVLLPNSGGVPWTVGSAVESRRATPGVVVVQEG